MKFGSLILVAFTIPVLASTYSFGSFPYNSCRTLSNCAASRQLGVYGPGQLFGLMTPSEMIARTRRGRDAIVQARKEAFQKAFQHYSPGYQVIDDETKFQVSVDVPGVKYEDLNINIEEDGKLLTLSGSREKGKDGYSYSSKFYQSFYLDPSVDTDRISANLQNGVLTVTAPKDMKRVDDAIKKIPITILEKEPAFDKNDANAAPGDRQEASSDAANEIQINEEEIDLDGPSEETV
jgi:HSP20 family molecular chaperone IbpA